MELYQNYWTLIYFVKKTMVLYKELWYYTENYGTVKTVVNCNKL